MEFLFAGSIYDAVQKAQQEIQGVVARMEISTIHDEEAAGVSLGNWIKRALPPVPSLNKEGMSGSRTRGKIIVSIPFNGDAHWFTLAPSSSPSMIRASVQNNKLQFEVNDDERVQYNTDAFLNRVQPTLELMEKEVEVERMQLREIGNRIIAERREHLERQAQRDATVNFPIR